MKQLSWYFTVSLMIVSLLAGLAAGYYMSPEYKQSMAAAADMDLGPADRWVDARYINAMIAHHRGAMLIAEQAEKNTSREEIRTLARDILASEPKLIQELYDWKKAWYTDTRRVPDPPVVNVGTAGNTFDLRVLNALIRHHEEGVRMTQEIRTKSTRGEILDNADAVEFFLTNSKKMLEQWRSEWYLDTQSP